MRECDNTRDLDLQSVAMKEEVLYMISLYLHKVYDNLERDRFLDILEEYRVGPWDCCVLCVYWDGLQMVDRAGGKYREKFQGFWGVAQGEPIPPIIFNVMVDTVMCHRISMVVGDIRRQDGWWREVLCHSIFFYADDVLIASADPVWLQGAFDTLAGLFDRVGL